MPKWRPIPFFLISLRLRWVVGGFFGDVYLFGVLIPFCYF